MVRRIKIEKRRGVLKIAEDAYSFFKADQDDGLVGMVAFSYRHSDRSGGIFFVCGECVNENGKPSISGKKYVFYTDSFSAIGRRMAATKIPRLRSE